MMIWDVISRISAADYKLGTSIRKGNKGMNELMELITVAYP